MSVRSRGLAKSARRKLAPADVEWAQLIAVMEDAHADRLCEHFELESTPLIVLDIPDEYRAMDPELVQMLRDGMASVLAKLSDSQPPDSATLFVAQIGEVAPAKNVDPPPSRRLRQ